MSKRMLECLAERSLRWEDEHESTFLWGEEVVRSYYDPDLRSCQIITNIDPKTHNDIKAWIIKITEEKLEDTDEN